MPTCNGPNCDREIVWIKDPETGAKVPLDSRRVTAYELDPDSELVAVHRRVYVSHFLTCPDARRFSGKRGK